MAKPELTEPLRYTKDQLRAIIAAGMSVSEARMLLDDGYTPEDVLELAQMQAAQKQAEIAAANQARANETATAVEKATNPSNRDHPGRSAMSYPEGDLKRPRPKIPYTLSWNGYPQSKFPEELSWMELELITGLRTEQDGTSTRLHRGLTPGVYDCLEKDGRTAHKVSVIAMKDATNRIEKMEVKFAVMRERKDHIPPVQVWLFQMVHADTMDARTSYMKGMLDYIDSTYQDEAAKLQPVGV